MTDLRQGYADTNERDQYKMMNYLNQNAGALTALLTLVLVLITAVYAYLTHKLAMETTLMREAQTEPKVDIALVPREEWINFVDVAVCNNGSGPAYDVQFDVRSNASNPTIEKLLGELRGLNMFSHGLRYLAPRREIRSFFTSCAEDAEEKAKSRIEVRISYRSSTGKSYDEAYSLDFSEIAGLQQLGESPMHKIASKVELIEKTLDKLTRGRLSINVYDAADRKAEGEACEARRQPQL